MFEITNAIRCWLYCGYFHLVWAILLKQVSFHSFLTVYLISVFVLYIYMASQISPDFNIHTDSVQQVRCESPSSTRTHLAHSALQLAVVLERASFRHEPAPAASFWARHRRSQPAHLQPQPQPLLRGLWAALLPGWQVNGAANISPEQPAVPGRWVMNPGSETGKPLAPHSAGVRWPKCLL